MNEPNKKSLIPDLDRLLRKQWDTEWTGEDGVQYRSGVDAFAQELHSVLESFRKFVVTNESGPLIIENQSDGFPFQILDLTGMGLGMRVEDTTTGGGSNYGTGYGASDIPITAIDFLPQFIVDQGYNLDNLVDIQPTPEGVEIVDNKPIPIDVEPIRKPDGTSDGNQPGGDNIPQFPPPGSPLPNIPFPVQDIINNITQVIQGDCCDPNEQHTYCGDVQSVDCDNVTINVPTTNGDQILGGSRGDLPDSGDNGVDYEYDETCTGREATRGGDSVNQSLDPPYEGNICLRCDGNPFGRNGEDVQCEETNPPDWVTEPECDE